MTLPAGISRIPLPYTTKSLEPYLSERTVGLHYDNHHKGYVDLFIKRMAALHRDYKTFEDAIRDTAGGSNIEESLNQLAVLSWNHNFYWPSMNPATPKLPESGPFHKAFVDSFGTVERFETLVREEAMKIGVGWVWLFAENGKLSVLRTNYFGTPVPTAKKPLLTLDVWEHAYYLDYQNRRDEYVDVWLKHLVNWDWARQRFES